MATSSILKEIVIDSPEAVERFIEALEMAKARAESDKLSEEEQQAIDWMYSPSLKDRIKSKRKHSRRRHDRKRIIEKRKKLAKTWLFGDIKTSPLIEEPGRMAKWNLTCSCWMCKWEKHNKKIKPKHRLFKEDLDYIIRR